MKFEVGERVHFTCNGKFVGLGIITEMGENTCIVESEGNQRSYLLGKSEIAKLDQPEPVKVPKFVAKWLGAYEDLFLGQDHTKNDVLERILLDWKRGHFYKGDLYWVNNNLITLIDAVRNGYVVEEEPKYYVKFPGAEFNVFLVKSDDGKIIFWSNTEAGTKFTKREIYELDERYWAFAIPVEEVEAE